MADIPQELLSAIDSYIDAKFNDLIRAHKLNAEVLSTDLTTFEEDQMLSFDGNENVNQGFFRKFLRWLSNYINTLMVNFQAITFDAIRYISPTDLAENPACGKIIAPFACLIVTGAGVKPTVPAPASTTPDDAGFNPATHLLSGGFAYNVTDNLWYYRGGDTIYELKEALSLKVVDISDFEDTLAGILEGYVQAVEGKELSDNNLTDELVTAIGDAESHINIENIHIPPDGISTRQSDDDAIEVIPDWVLGLLSATLPLAIDAEGNITLAIDETTLAVVEGKLTVIGGGGGGDAKLSFNEGTGILSIDPLGDSSVDLSSLAAGEGADLSNYVKKVGETSQTVQGNLLATGECEAFS